MSAWSFRKIVNTQRRLIEERFKKIKHKIIIMSGKGGVGKSFIAANISVALADLSKKVCVFDADFHGPDIPKILGVHGKIVYAGPEGIEPIMSKYNVKVISLDLMVSNEESPIIWRGPLKIAAIRQLLAEVNWGELDYFIIDLPPGTGDEPLSIAQEVPNIDGIILVTTPSEVSLLDVRRAAGFAKRLNIPILGIVENMSYYKCPVCGYVEYPFGKKGGEMLARKLGVKLLGKIPLDVKINEANDLGKPFVKIFPDNEITKEIIKIAREIISMLESS